MTVYTNDMSETLPKISMPWSGSSVPYTSTAPSILLGDSIRSTLPRVALNDPGWSQTKRLVGISKVVYLLLWLSFVPPASKTAQLPFSNKW